MTTTKTKERPIIFGAEMVRAIRDRRKWETRRVIKPQPHPTTTFLAVDSEGRWIPNNAPPEAFEDLDSSTWRCPYGVPGDRLWVREAWCGHWGPDTAPNGRKVAGVRVRQSDGSYVESTESDPLVIYYRADWESWEKPWPHSEWRSPIHMPRKASRLTLKLTDVRAERLKEIDEEGIAAEGVELSPAYGGDPRMAYIGGRQRTWMSKPHENDPPFLHRTWARGIQGLRGEFACAWDRVNGDTHPFSSNPMVWVDTFSPVEV